MWITRVDGREMEAQYTTAATAIVRDAVMVDKLVLA